MSLNNTASGQRVHIGFFGIRNAGKSSIVNKLTNQEISLVSAHKGTTTDPVKKAMEILSDVDKAQKNLEQTVNKYK